MTFDEYKEEILNGDKIDWYGEMVPVKLMTPVVRYLADMIIDSLDKMIGEVADMRNGTREKVSKQHYIDNIWNNIRHLPYTSNGLISDCYMIKYKRIIKEFGGDKVKPKVRKPRKPKEPINKTNDVEPTTPVVKGKRGKNNDLIFGKK